MRGGCIGCVGGGERYVCWLVACDMRGREGRGWCHS